MNAIEAIRINPCPFCGAHVVSWQIADEFGRKGHRIGCINAECDMRPYTITNWKTESDCIEAWNRRAEDKTRLAIVEIRNSLAGHQHVDCNRCAPCKIMRICDDALNSSTKG